MISDLFVKIRFWGECWIGFVLLRNETYSYFINKLVQKKNANLKKSLRVISDVIAISPDLSRRTIHYTCNSKWCPDFRRWKWQKSKPGYVRRETFCSAWIDYNRLNIHLGFWISEWTAPFDPFQIAWNHDIQFHDIQWRKTCLTGSNAQNYLFFVSIWISEKAIRIWKILSYF